MSAPSFRNEIANVANLRRVRGRIQGGLLVLLLITSACGKLLDPFIPEPSLTETSSLDLFPYWPEPEGPPLSDYHVSSGAVTATAEACRCTDRGFPGCTLRIELAVRDRETSQPPDDEESFEVVIDNDTFSLTPQAGRLVFEWQIPDAVALAERFGTGLVALGVRVNDADGAVVGWGGLRVAVPEPDRASPVLWCVEPVPGSFSSEQPRVRFVFSDPITAGAQVQFVFHEGFRAGEGLIWYPSPISGDGSNTFLVSLPPTAPELHRTSCEYVPAAAVYAGAPVTWVASGSALLPFGAKSPVGGASFVEDCILWKRCTLDESLQPDCTLVAPGDMPPR